MSVSWVSNERSLITPEISVDLVVFKIVRRVWRVISYLINGHHVYGAGRNQFKKGDVRTLASSTLGP